MEQDKRGRQVVPPPGKEGSVPGPHTVVAEFRCGHRRILHAARAAALEQAVQAGQKKPCPWCEILSARSVKEALVRLPTTAGTHNLYRSYCAEGMPAKRALRKVVECAVKRCPHCLLDYFLGERMRYCDRCRQVVCDRCFNNPCHCAPGKGG